MSRFGRCASGVTWRSCIPRIIFVFLELLRDLLLRYLCSTKRLKNDRGPIVIMVEKKSLQDGDNTVTCTIV